MQIAGTEVWPKTSFGILLVVLLLFTASFAQAPATSPAAAPARSLDFYDPLPQDTGEAGLKLQLRNLQTTARLMILVAHPDDEYGGLYTPATRGKGVQTLLMTLTRR